MTRGALALLAALLAALLGCTPRRPGVERVSDSHPRPLARSAGGAVDSDRDCIPDHREDRDGDGRVDPGETDPRRRDTDRDGLADGAEDRNCNGRRDRHETDPTRRDTDGDGAGDGVEVTVTRTNPLTTNEDHELRDAIRTRLGRHDATHIPEPLRFDLVRSLGARRDEFEINVLTQLNRFNSRPLVSIAPEIEWAFATGHALELEFGWRDDAADYLKLAYQGTFGTAASHRFIHGWQWLAEASLRDDDISTTVLYLLGYRVDPRWSVLAMLGTSASVDRDGQHVAAAGIVNASVFADLTDHLTLGLEANLRAAGEQGFALSVLPQVHGALGRVFRVQFGVGPALEDGRWGPSLALRLIAER